MTNIIDEAYEEKEGEIMMCSNFVKENIQKGYNLMVDYITSEDVEEEVYCQMRAELSKLKIVIPKEIYNKMEKNSDDYLEPIIYDAEIFFGDLYTEEYGNYDENGVFYLKNEEATFKFMGLFLEKIWNVQKQIEKFGIDELYPILIK